MSNTYSKTKSASSTLGTITRSSLLPIFIAIIALGVAVLLVTSTYADREKSAAKQSDHAGSPAASAERAAPSNLSSLKGTAGPRETHRPLLNLLAPTVTATKTDALVATPNNGDGKADPGDTINYTVNISASGENATGVTFEDTVDPNTAFVGGSLTVTPVAIDDSYTATGNVRIQVPAASGVLLSGDDDYLGIPTATLSGFGATSGTANGTVVNGTNSVTTSNGGTVILSSDGSFSYNPPAGFEGADSFFYTLTNSAGSNVGQVTITVSGMIWFINNNAGACSVDCNGRLTNPFTSLAAFEAVNGGGGNNPAAGDNIFIYESATDYSGPVTLEDNQKFIGQDATAALATIAGITLAPHSDALPPPNPTAAIVNITGNGITVGSNNTLRGFTGGNATTDITGTGFGTLTISEVTLDGSGQALALTNGTLAATFGSISSTDSGATAINLTTVAGSLTSGGTVITNPTGSGISIATSGGAFNFGNTLVTGSSNTGVVLTTNTGAITFGDLDISPDGGQGGLLATDNTQTITATSGTIVTTTGIAVEITRASSTTPLAMALTHVSSNGAPNGIVLRNTSGSFTVIGDGANTTVGGNSTGGTITGATGADGAIAGNGIYLENAGNVTLRRMTINGTNQNNGIRGISVINFTLEFSTVSGTNGTSGVGDESAVQFDNLTGSGAITSCVIEGGFEDNLNVVNTSGTLNRLTISGTTFGFNSDAGGNNSITFDSQNAGTTLNFTLKSSLIKGSNIDWLNAGANSGSTMDAVIGGPLVADGNSFDNTGANAFAGSPIPNGNRLVTGSIGNMTLDIRNNTLKGSLGEAIRVRSSATGALTGLMNARVRNNTIGVAATANSGSTGGSGIFVLGDGGSDMNVAVTNNSVFQYNQSGIMLQFGDEINPGAVYNATVTGNTVNTPGTLLNNFNGIQLNNGTILATDDFTTCADIGGAGVGNNVAASGKGAAAPNNSDIRLRQRFNTTVRLPGYVGPSRDDVDFDVAEVAAYLAGRNTLNTANGGSQANGGYVGGAACTAPTVPALTNPEDSITSGLSAETMSVLSAVERRDGTLFATKGENTNEQHVVKLTQSEVSAMVQVAIARWAEAGLSAATIAKLQSLSFEIADLPAGQLATVTSSKITLDETAAGYGWFFDATPYDDNEFGVPVQDKELQTIDTSEADRRIDLLTVLMRQLGTQVSLGKSALKGAPGWLMEGTLGTGERRAPAFKVRTISKVQSAPGATARQVRASTVAEKREASYQQVASLNKQRNSRGLLRKHHAASTPPAAMTVADVSLNIGTLPAGESVTITFQVTVDNPFQGATAQVSNQGTVSGTNFSSVFTDDPSVGGAADPTVTPVDLPDVTVAVAPASVLEDGSDTLVYTFTREGSTTDSMTVNFSVTGTATFSTDYTQSGAATFNGTGTVVIPSGSATATVTVDPTPDTPVEPDETVILTVTSGIGYEPGTPASASGTITNDDTDVSVAVAPLSVDEDGGTNLVYTFTRTGVTSGALTVNFSVGGTAGFTPPGDDYTQTGAATFDATSGTVNFTAGSPTATVTVDPTADTTVEPNETVVLTVVSGTGYGVGAPSVAQGTINNDDTTVSVAVSPASVLEDGATNMVYTFTRTDGDGALTVNFSVTGTATFGDDYTQTGATTFGATSGTVTFADTVTTAQVTVDPTADVTAEGNETVILTVTAGVGYTPGTPNSATGTITNDDNAVSVAVSPSSVAEDGGTNLVYTFTRTDSTGTLTADFSVSGTALFTNDASTDYTQSGAATFTATSGSVSFADGSLTAQVTLDPSTDTTVEPDETAILTVIAGVGYGVGSPASAEGTITNDDTAVSVAVSPSSTAEDGAGTLVYTFTRTGVTTGALTVNFSIGGTATFGAGNDYTQTGAATFNGTGTVIFSAGSPTATVTVDPNADNAAESDETVILTVTSGSGYNVGAPSVASGTITNDDAEVTVAVAPSSVLEDGPGTMVYTFTRTGFTGAPLTVSFTVGGTAIFAPPNTDYFQTGADPGFSATAGTVTFTGTNTTATVTVDPLDDIDPEPNETVVFTLIPGTGYSVGSPASATGTILTDDASPPVIQVGYGQCNAASNGTLNLILSDADTPTSSLTLSASSSNTAVVPNANITFGGSGANRTITINAVPQLALAFSDVTITVSDGTLTTSINMRIIVGTNGTESINIGTTTVGSDMIFGRNGDDTINSGAGNDLICGGNSGGIINAGLGDDTVDGGNGNDTLRGGDGNDLLLGGGGNDTLEGGNDNDTLNGGGGTDTLRGEGGDDTMTGGSGPDSFNGGLGFDTVTDFHAGQDTKVDVIEVGSLFPGLKGGEGFGYLAVARPWWDSPSPPWWDSRFADVVRFAFLR